MQAQVVNPGTVIWEAGISHSSLTHCAKQLFWSAGRTLQTDQLSIVGWPRARQRLCPSYTSLCQRREWGRHGRGGVAWAACHSQGPLQMEASLIEA